MSLVEPAPGDYFPSNDTSHIYAKRLGGFDLYKSTKSWLAIVATEDQYGKRSVKMFRWQKRISVWKNTLCNMRIDYLDFDLINEKIKVLKKEFGISGDSNLSTQEKNERDADEIRKKQGVSDEPAKPDIEHRIPIEKYHGYEKFGDWRTSLR